MTKIKDMYDMPLFAGQISKEGIFILQRFILHTLIKKLFYKND